jgi:F-type H+-transporting ATPase subunit alpha
VRGFLDKIETSKISEFQVKFLEGLRSDHADIFDEINNTGNFSDESDQKIEAYLEKFTANFS